MAYCTKADILGVIAEDTLIGLTDDHGVGRVDESKVSSAIAFADALIDSYCAKRYPVPFSPVPEQVKNLSVAIAIHRLYGNRQGAPDFRVQDKDDAISFLKDVSMKKASLGADAPAEISGDTSDNTIDFSSSAPVFSRDKLKGF